ncbi:MAG: hypothetical protein FWG91_02645 [Lachnospiraceae bacterium]|nr:hypothetical protein [Lachnospiraceae bacterium]
MEIKICFNAINFPNYLSPQIIKAGAKGKKIYFGTGLASSKEASCGFGFELLNMILTALILADNFNADGILHEIGTVGYEISQKYREALVKEQLKCIKNLAKNLCIDDKYTVKLSHTYQESYYFKHIFEEVKNKMSLFSNISNFQRYGNYINLQIAQMKYLYEVEKAVVKVGWIIGSKPVLKSVDENIVKMFLNQGKLNEYYFDSIYRYVFPNDDFSFIYTPAGLDIIDGRKYSPYTVTKSQNRPLLHEPIKPYIIKMPNTKYKKKAIKFYESSILSNWEHFFGEIKAFDEMEDDEKIINKLQYIQDKALNL